ncbi:vanadium-dependent haloperoxidase [Nocardioides sp. SR21]|uniref:vanadium-dependent haloperoxidase n=1 Tax=Nocardioides sp. SR21 TaxID=2919501 RepID=UPI001FA9B890|nr:vanadium-dependent haloperoxidase [Nocardioides sp. SR21]
MRSHLKLVGAGVVLALAVGGASAPASQASGPGHGHGPDVSGDAVRAWNQIAVDTLIGLPGPAGGAPPAAAVHVGMVQGAVFDAVNAIAHREFRPYLLHKRFPRWASQDAATAAAAYGVLHDIVSTVPVGLTDEQRATRLATLDTQYADALAAVPDGWAETKGVAAGEAAAAAMIADRQGDGRFGPSQWVPNSAPGHWSPSLDPVTNQPILDPTPWVGGVRPFTMTSSSQFRTAGPLALTSTQWATDFNEVKAIGSATSAVRTAEQGYIARWWQSTPVRSWNEVARDLADRNDLNALDTARMLALANLSGADAAINCWNDKYYWDFWRPLNAIRRAAEDGNAGTEPDAAWTPLISAPYPDHPSGHLCLDGAYTTILRAYFGNTIQGGYSITSVSSLLLAGEATVRTFGSFSQVLDEIVEARIWAGLHFRTADRQGKWLGIRVAWHAGTHYLRPLRHHHHGHHG